MNGRGRDSGGPARNFTEFLHAVSRDFLFLRLIAGRIREILMLTEEAEAGKKKTSAFHGFSPFFTLPAGRTYDMITVVNNKSRERQSPAFVIGDASAAFSH